MTLEQEMLVNIRDTLSHLHGKRVSQDAQAYDRAIHDGRSPEGAWSVFSSTLRKIDVWTELEDVDSLIEKLS